MALLGKVDGTPPSKREIDNAIYKAAGTCAKGIIHFAKGTFQVMLTSPELAQKLLAGRLKLQGRPVTGHAAALVRGCLPKFASAEFFFSLLAPRLHMGIWRAPVFSWGISLETLALGVGCEVV